MKKHISAIALASLLIASPFASANLSVNIGAINVNPDSGTSDINENNALGLSVDDNTQLGITVDYALDDNWVLELVAATPFDHDIKGESALAGATLGDTKHLPPTLLAQYHFGQKSDAFRAFVGAGLNYTTFFDEQAGSDLKAALGTNDVELKLDDSFGIALQAGFNYMFDEKWGLHGMVSWIDIDSDATVYANGAKALTSTVKIDPVVTMLGVKYRF